MKCIGGELIYSSTYRRIDNTAVPVLSKRRRIAISFLFLAILIQVSIAKTAVGSAVKLTAEERAWLDAHPVISLGSPIIPPWNFVDKKTGLYMGIVPDYLDLIGSKLGIKFKSISDDFGKIHQMARDKEIDGIGVAGKTAEREEFLNFAEPYITLQYSIVTQKESAAVATFADLAHKRAGIFEASAAYAYLRKNYPDVELITFKDYDAGILAVLNGEIEAWVGSLAGVVHAIDRKGLFGLKMAVVPFEMSKEMRIGVRKDWPKLVTILSKTIASIDQKEHFRIRGKWLAYSPEDQKVKRVNLTPEEQSWLTQNHTVQVRVVNIPPYIVAKKGQDPEGISIDFLKFIAKRTGVKFNYRFSGKTFPEALDGLKKRKGPDLITSMMHTPEREKSILFTNYYFRSPYVIFTHKQDESFVNDMADLKGRMIALPKGTVILEKVKRAYPDLQLVLFDNDALAIEAVVTKKADAYIGNLALASFFILEKGLSVLKIAGPSPFGDHVLSMGVRNDWPALVSIMDKALATMSPAEQAKIRNKYMAIRYEHSQTTVIVKWVGIISGAAFMVIFLFVFWNRQLTRRVKKRTAEIRESRDYLKSLTNSMPDAIFSVKMPDRKIEWANDTFEVIGYKADECVGKSTEFLYPNRKAYLAVGEALAHAIAEEKEVLRLEQDLRKMNGNLFPADITISIFKLQGKVTSVTGIVRDISERRQRERRLQKYQERLKALAFQLTVAEERERRRIAADLHDHVGQALALARMQVAKTKKRATDAPMSVELDQISDTLYDALQDTRQLMFDLSPPSLNELGLSAAIFDCLEVQIGKRYNIDTAFLDELDDQLEPTSEESSQTIIFRNVRELLINVVKHAQAKKVSVHLKKSNGRLKIIVEDDGIGFDPEAIFQLSSKDGGFGLFSIQERMDDLGGSLDVQSAPGKGCTVVLEIPIGKD